MIFVFCFLMLMTLIYEKLVSKSVLNIFLSIVGLQCCVGFECTPKWISDRCLCACIHTHVCTHPFSDSFLKHVIVEYWGEFPVLYSRSFFVIYLIHSNVCLLIPRRFKLQKARSWLTRTLQKGWRRTPICSVFLFLLCQSSHCSWFLAIVVMWLDGEMGRGMPRGMFRVIQHHRLNGHEFEQAPGVGGGQGGLVCCSPWGRKESDTTERLKWTAPQ